MKVLAAALGLLVAGSCVAQSPSGALIVGDKGYVLLPTELVCEPTVQDAEWSPNGRSVIAIRTRILATPAQLQNLLEGKAPAGQPETEQSLVLWSALRRTSKEIFKLSSRQGAIQGVGWFGGTDIAYATVNFREGPTHWALYRIAASTGQMKAIATDTSNGFWRPSPLRPLGLAVSRATEVVVSPARERTIPSSQPPANMNEGRILDDEGKVLATFSSSNLSFPQWSADGRRAYWRAYEVVQTVGAPPVRVPYQALDLQTGAITRIDKPTDIYQEPTSTLRLEAATVSGARVTPSPRALLLSADGPEGGPLLITGDFQMFAKLSPAQDGVLYKSDDALFVRPMLQLDAQQLRDMRAAAERAELLSRGKQCALALIMYASDYDDVFPPAGDVSTLLMPYVRNASLLQGFTYTFKGGPMKDIERPAETELGFVQGSGGRAVAYMDGHVVWRKD